MKECSKCRHCYDDAYTICPLDDKPLMTTITGNILISGRYLLEQRLGNGGMGIVFRARHQFLKSQHAVKIILPSLVEQDGNLLARFKQEAVLAASINHPNVIRVTDFGVEDDTMPYLVMEFVDGTPLSSFLKPGEPLLVKEAFNLFKPIASGVMEAHRRGIIHRDLKPQNIMVQKDLPLKKAIKVLDFGLAKIKASESLGSFIQTQTRNILGSPPYMSPEQWENVGVDHRADIYGLGVILFQMLTGHLPFDGDSIPAVMFQHLTVEAPGFASFGISHSPEIETVVRRALQKNPDARPHSVEEMLDEFEHALTRSENLSLPVSIQTEIMQKPGASDKAELPPTSDKVDLPPTVLDDITSQLTKSQRETLFSYFDPAKKDTFLPNEHLAQEFLEAKDRAEEAKVKAIEHDKLVQEFAEAQKFAEEAGRKALEAKQKMEVEVRRQLEAEMQDKLAVEQQARQKAEAERLAKEVEARKNAEERANYLAQAALEAQKLAEIERKKSEQAAHQRELEESVRRQAEVQARQLAQQVEEAKRNFEEAKKQAEYEAALRIVAENKQKNIESELQVVAVLEAERRKVIEAEAEKQVKEKVSRFEQEAQAAQKRVEEARSLADLEVQKREQAEAARVFAEAEAKRLAQEILQAQKHIEELKLHTSIDAQHQSSPNISQSGKWSDSNPTLVSVPQNLKGELTIPIVNADDTANAQFQSQLYNPQPTSQIQGQVSSNLHFSHDLHTRLSSPPSKFSPLLYAGGGLAAVLMLALGGYLFYFFALSKSTDTPAPGKTTDNGNSAINDGGKATKTPPDILKNLVLIQGGSFQMGRSDVEKLNKFFGDQFPAHTVTVDSFKIAKTETTNEEYAEFVKEKNYPPPQDWKNGKPPEGDEKLPVTFVSMNDAKAYTDWVSQKFNKPCRLPTEEEWEYAARNGSRANSFPWGDSWQPSSANVNRGKPSEVGTLPDETMVGGLKDMLGNVQEWTSTKYALYPGHTASKPDAEIKGEIIARGSAYVAASVYMEKPQWLITLRSHYPSDQKTLSWVGFRIVCQP